MKTFARFNRFPPVLVRLLARHPKGLALTNEEISVRCGLSLVKIVAISSQTGWDDVTVRDACLFLRGCGLDFDSRTQVRRNLSYLQGERHRGKRIPPTWRHLRRSTEWRTQLRPLLELFQAHLKRQMELTKEL